MWEKVQVREQEPFHCLVTWQDYLHKRDSCWRTLSLKKGKYMWVSQVKNILNCGG